MSDSRHEYRQRAGVLSPCRHTRAIAELKGVGRDYPLSIEKLCPVLYYVVADWQEGCERCKQILRYGGMGHTMSIHSTNDQIILEFGLKKPAFRICVNTPTTHGSIGSSTGLDPAMTLGCGGFGGNITSDNTPAALDQHQARGARIGRSRPSARQPAARAGCRRARTLRPAGLSGVGRERPSGELSGRTRRNRPDVAPESISCGCSFVCEEDVRQALALGRTILIDDRTIVTPLARDLGEARKVLITAGLAR